MVKRRKQKKSENIYPLTGDITDLAYYVGIDNDKNTLFRVTLIFLIYIVGLFGAYLSGKYSDSDMILWGIYVGIPILLIALWLTSRKLPPKIKKENEKFVKDYGKKNWPF